MALTCILTSLTTLLCLFIFCVDAATNQEFLQMEQVFENLRHHIQENSFNLLGYAWDLWTNNSGMDLMDSALDDSDADSTSNSKHRVPRYVNIGLLCVQESPADRPTMSDVVSMIGNDTLPLPSPKPPAFLNIRDIQNSLLPGSMPQSFSVNLITDSLVEAR